MSRNCPNCGKTRRPVIVGNSIQYYTRCGCDEIPSLDDIFETKPFLNMNNNHLEKDIANPPSTPGAIFGDDSQLHPAHDLLSGELGPVHDLLSDTFNEGSLLSSHSDCEMSDVWLSMEQAFENDLSDFMPDTDDNLRGSCLVTDLIDSAACLQELSQTIKAEPLDFEDAAAGLEFAIKVEVDDKLDYCQPFEKTLNFPLNSNAGSKSVTAAVSDDGTTGPTTTILSITEEKDKKLFSCQQCGKKYSSLQELKCHKMLCCGSNASDSSRPYKCEKCGCSYTRKYHLDTHKDRYHSNSSYSCGKCLKIYRAREDYLRHLRKNSCSTASRTTKTSCKTSQELIMNSQRLHNVHRFPCRHCPKRFFRRHYLERHIEEKHHKDWSEQETCEICTPSSSRNMSNASSPGTDISITPGESDFSSDDSGLMADEAAGNIMSNIVRNGHVSQRCSEVTSSTVINVIGHSDELIGNGLYIKPDSSLYQCVMCDYTTKYITQLSRHLEKHQANTTAVASRKNFIVTV